jgi:hypothetical protein
MVSMGCEMKDIWRQFEALLDKAPQDRWLDIRDEWMLENCIGVDQGW